MSDELSETILLKPGVINAAVKHEWADKARLLKQQVEEWELEAKRLYGVGQDIEEMRVALEAKLEAIIREWLECPQDSVPDNLKDAIDAAQKEQSDDNAT